MNDRVETGISPDSLRITVVYALALHQAVIDLHLRPDSTVMDAVQRSGLLQQFPELARQPLVCAIFSRPVATTASLRDGDRVEILRPLRADPKESRRQAAARSRKQSG